MAKSLSPDRRAALLLKQMTLDEKIKLLHGTGGNWQVVSGDYRVLVGGSSRDTPLSATLAIK